MTITSNCQLIDQTLNQLRNQLITKLHNCYIKKDPTTTLTELIEAVNEIKANETINPNNIRPNDMPKIDDTNISAFNITLYARIRYYMRLLGYFLVLKGVPVYEVNAQTDLKGLIDLIDMIDVIKPSFLTLEPVDETQYFGTNIKVEYTLIDDDGSPIQEGDITIKDSAGIIYDSIEAGNPITFEPLNVSPMENGTYQYETFTIIYNGSDNYAEAIPQTFRVKILPAKINLVLTAVNTTTTSRYFNSNNIGCNTDEWMISINTFNHQNQPLANIPFDLTIGDNLVLDDEETDNEGSYVLNHQVIEQLGNQAINCTTNYLDTNKMSNTSASYEVIIKNNILVQKQNEYTDYLGKSSYLYEIELVNEETGQKTNQYDGMNIKIFLREEDSKNEGIGEQIATATIIDGKATYTFTSLTIGNKILTWVFEHDEGDDRISTKLHILSNFILPKEQNYFLNDTPIFIYAPEGVRAANVRISANTSYSYDGHNFGIGETVSTNDNGEFEIQNFDENNTSYTYSTSFTTPTNNLNETCHFTYKLRKPFDITLLNYNKKTKVQYKITLYSEKEPYFIDIVNSNSNSYLSSDLYSVSIIPVDDTNPESTYRTLIIDIPASEETFGDNTLSFTLNEYGQSVNFSFIDKVFDLLTESVNLGKGTMQIRCNDDSVTSIDIDSSSINVNTISYENNIFTIDATFTQAGTISFTVTDDLLSIEEFSIQVNKVNIESYVNVDVYVTSPESTFTKEDVIDYVDIDNIEASFNVNTKLYSDLSIIYMIKQESNQLHTQSFTYYAEEDNNFTLNMPTFTPGQQYQAEFIFSGNNNYLAFSKEINFRILGGQPTHEIMGKHTVFKVGLPFTYKPKFTNEEPEKLIEIHDPWEGGPGTGHWLNQSNGVWESVGYALAEGWTNTKSWECDFDIKGGVLYIGLHIYALESNSLGAHLFGRYEHGLATDPPGTFTRDNNSELAFVNKSGSIWSGGDNRYFDWCHINIKKTSPTTLTITKTGGKYNDGSVTYEWQELSNYSKFTIATVGNGTGAVIDKMMIKNFIVRGEY